MPNFNYYHYNYIHFNNNYTTNNHMRFVFAFFTLALHGAFSVKLRNFGEDPSNVPDYVLVPSEQCDFCKTTIDELEMKWTNETEVAAILADLEVIIFLLLS